MSGRLEHVGAAGERRVGAHANALVVVARVAALAEAARADEGEDLVDDLAKEGRVEGIEMAFGAEFSVVVVEELAGEAHRVVALVGGAEPGGGKGSAEWQDEEARHQVTRIRMEREKEVKGWKRCCKVMQNDTKWCKIGIKEAEKRGKRCHESDRSDQKRREKVMTNDH